MKKKRFLFDARVVSVHCFIFSVKNFLKLTKARGEEVLKPSRNPGFYFCWRSAHEACWWRQVRLHNWALAFSGDLHFLQCSGGKGIRTGLTFLETFFLSGLELREFIQFIYGGRVILMSDTFNARALFLAVWSKSLFTFLCPFAKTLPFSRVSFREVTPSISSS